MVNDCSSQLCEIMIHARGWLLLVNDGYADGYHSSLQIQLPMSEVKNADPKFLWQTPRSLKSPPLAAFPRWPWAPRNAAWGRPRGALGAQWTSRCPTVAGDSYGKRLRKTSTSSELCHSESRFITGVAHLAMKTHCMH